jgi:hypothetical protein
MFKEIKKEILENQFIYDLRNKFEINANELIRLKNSLIKLKAIWAEKTSIDKELMQVLYGIPMVILFQVERNEYSENEKKFLEDAWIDIDNLIMECLISSN